MKKIILSVALLLMCQTLSANQQALHIEEAFSDDREVKVEVKGKKLIVHGLKAWQGVKLANLDLGAFEVLELRDHSLNHRDVFAFADENKLGHLKELFLDYPNSYPGALFELALADLFERLERIERLTFPLLDYSTETFEYRLTQFTANGGRFTWIYSKCEQLAQS